MTRSKASKGVAEQRTDEVLRIVLDGAQLHDICAFVRNQEKEKGSVWFVAEDATPLSDATIRRYQQRAYRLIDAHHEKSRKRLLRRHGLRVLIPRSRSLDSRACPESHDGRRQANSVTLAVEVASRGCWL